MFLIIFVSFIQIFISYRNVDKLMFTRVYGIYIEYIHVYGRVEKLIYESWDD